MILFIILNIVSFFRIIVIILVIYYGFKMLMRFIAPKVVEKAANKLFQEMNFDELIMYESILLKSGSVYKPISKFSLS